MRPQEAAHTLTIIKTNNLDSQIQFSLENLSKNPQKLKKYRFYQQKGLFSDEKVTQ